jgi:hypothetical protein
MNAFTTPLLLVAALFLGACGGHPNPAERPYSAAEIKQLALEDLSRRSLSMEEYLRRWDAIMKPQPGESFSAAGRSATDRLGMVEAGD